MAPLDRAARPTGRCVRGAMADLVELVDAEGRLYTAIVFAEDYRNDPLLAQVVSKDIVARSPGVFVYPWSGRTVREVAMVAAEDGGGGVRAALELLLAAAPLLDPPHGGLTAWHLLVDAEAQVRVLGAGLPALDVLDFRADEA